MSTKLMTFNFNELSVKKNKKILTIQKNIFDMFQSVKTGQRQDHLQFATQFFFNLLGVCFFNIYLYILADRP